MGIFDAITSEREDYFSVSEVVGIDQEPTPPREGYTSTAEMIGYSFLYGDRSAFASVHEAVGVKESVSTREAHASVGELLGYGSIFHDRTGYVGVHSAVTFRLPEYDDLPQPQAGWGNPLVPLVVIRVFRGTDASTASVSSYVGATLHAKGEAHATISGEVVAPQ